MSPPLKIALRASARSQIGAGARLRRARAKRRRAMVVMGTRPEVMKLAPVVLELRRRRRAGAGLLPSSFQVVLVGTGQHREMVPQHLALFGLHLDHDLKVMKPRQTLADITARTMQRMDVLLAQQQPDVVMVEGDTTAVLIAGLAAFYRQVPVAHVEAGLRSGDAYNPFPEEMNRRLVGGLAALHFAPTATARDNLLRENVPADRIYVTGNTSIDALLIASAARPRRLAIPEALLKGKRLVLVTAHRRESWGAGIRDICLALRQLAEEFPDVVVVYAVHPNPIVRDTVREILPFGFAQACPERSRRGRSGCEGVHLASPASGGRGGGKSWWERVHLIEPPDYAGFVDLMERSYLILTDSGGIQEEAPSLGKPVLVMRRTTERVEGVEAGCSELVGTDRTRIVERTARLLTDRRAYRAMVCRANPYGDGKAASRIRRALAHHFGLARRRPADFRGQ